METLKNVRNNNNVKICKSRKLRVKYKIKRPEEIQNVLEKIKQTIQGKAARLRRYQKRSRFYKDNNLFKNNPKQFCRNNGKSQIKISQTPWIEKFSKEYEAIKKQEWSEITFEELKHALKKSSKWKSPGKDKIPNFWLNAFHEIHTRLTQLIILLSLIQSKYHNGLSTASPTYYLNLMRLIIVLLPV